MRDRIKKVRQWHGLSQVEFAQKLGVKSNQIISIENNKQQIPGIVLEKIVEIFQVDGNWLLSGAGQMTINQEVVNHGKESNVVTTGVNNGNIVAQAGKSSALGGRDVRICQFVRWWMDAHEPDDQAWFEKQLERAVPEYGAWKKSNTG